MKLMTLVFLFAISVYGYAQQIETPKKEFVVLLSQDKIEISKGENREIEMTLLKSKGYMKGGAVMGLSSSLPKGIEVTFTPDKGKFEATKVLIKANETAVAGQYTLIVNAMINNKTKASIIKIIITDKTLASDNK